MAMKRAKIKSIPYEEFKDNETYEKLVEELNAGGTNIIVRKLDDLIDWGRSNSLWPLTFATSCCGIEFMAVCAARYDIARFGFEVTRNSPVRPMSFWSVVQSPLRWLRYSAASTTKWQTRSMLLPLAVAQFRAVRLQSHTTCSMVWTRLFQLTSTYLAVLHAPKPSFMV